MLSTGDHIDDELEAQFATLSISNLPVSTAPIVHVTKHHQPWEHTSSSSETADMNEKTNFIQATLCRIPPEILGKILLCLRREAYHTRHDREIQSYRVRSRKYQAWSVHSVPICRHIRATAIATPELWSFIEFGKINFWRTEQWLELYMTRSGSVPLTLRVNLAGLRFDETMDLPDMTTLALRTHDLTLLNCTLSHRHACKWFTNAPRVWPNLQYFTTLQLRRTRSITCHVLNNSGMLSGSSSKLVSLRLMGLHLALALPHCPQLQHLALGRFSLGHTYQELCQLLSVSTALLSLTLETVYDYHNNQNPSHPVFNLPLLREIYMSGNSIPIRHMLSILPRPHANLSVSLGKTDWCPVKQSPEALVALVRLSLAHLSSNQDSNSAQYKITFEMHEKDQRKHPYFTFGQIVDHSPDPKHKTVHLSGDCQLNAISLLLEHTAIVELDIEQHLHFVVDADKQRPHPTVKHISVLEWSPEPDKIQVLEDYLRQRYERGDRVETLTVVKGSKKDIPLRLARRWMEEALVFNAIRRTPSARSATA